MMPTGVSGTAGPALRALDAATEREVAAVYDRAAGDYDRFRGLWLRMAGARAEDAMLTDLRAALRPGAKVLDAGCGTGALARKMLALEPAIELTMLDASAAMLARTSDIPGAHVLGSVLDLPFEDGAFDVVVSAWVIETVSDPARVVSEYLRVINARGEVLYTFCSLPEGWFSRAGSAWLRDAVKRGFAGNFLDAAHTPWHDCAASHLLRFRHGLVSEVALRKCCPISPTVLPDAADARALPTTPQQ